MESTKQQQHAMTEVGENTIIPETRKTFFKTHQDKGYAYFDWNISSGDAGGTTDPNVEYQNVISGLSKKKGNVILMHDIKKHTSQAIEKIVKYGLDNGYTFKVLTPDVVCHQRINN